MQSNMDRDRHHADVQRALALGRTCDPAGLPELNLLCGSPSAEVRRLAASAIGKPRLLQERLSRLVRIEEHSNPTPAS